VLTGISTLPLVQGKFQIQRVVMRRADAHHPADFVQAESLHGVERVVVTVPDVDIFLRKFLRNFARRNITNTSENNFPAGAGIASSAAAFAALALAGSKAAGLDLSEPELSVLARRGSGSAARSIPAGFVEWQMGKDESRFLRFSIAPLTIGIWWIALPSSVPRTRRPAPRRDMPSQGQVHCRMRAWRMLRAA
jgi:hypothetical protein